MKARDPNNWRAPLSPAPVAATSDLKADEVPKKKAGRPKKDKSSGE